MRNILDAFAYVLVNSSFRMVIASRQQTRRDRSAVRQQKPENSLTFADPAGKVIKSDTPARSSLVCWHLTPQANLRDATPQAWGQEN